MSYRPELYLKPMVQLVTTATPSAGAVGIVAKDGIPPVGLIATQQIKATFETKTVTDARFRLLVDALYALLMRGSAQSDPEELARCTNELDMLRQQFANEDNAAR